METKRTKMEQNTMLSSYFLEQGEKQNVEV
jgi:hypothetical protein